MPILASQRHLLGWHEHKIKTRFKDILATLTLKRTRQKNVILIHLTKVTIDNIS